MLKKLRVIAAVVGALLLVLWGLTFTNPLSGSAAMGFLWEVLLGAGLGALLGWLPVLSGTPGSKTPYRTQWWIAVVVILIVLLTQYLLRFYIGNSVPFLNWLRVRHDRVLVGEGVLLGHTLVYALRSRR